MKIVNKYSFIIVLLLVLCLFIPNVIKSNNKRSQKNDLLSSSVSDTSSEDNSSANQISSNIIKIPSESNEQASKLQESQSALSSSSNSENQQSMQQESAKDDTTSPSQDKSKNVQSETPIINSQPSSIYFAPEIGTFKQGDKSYFDDALFIGDSRIVGLRDYGTLKNADYFVNVGMSIYNLKKSDVDFKGVKSGFDEIINKRQYKKIYISLGINEIGYNKEKTIQQYHNFINELLSIQKNAIIFINANLLVTEHCSKTDKYSHNNEIIQYNNMLSRLADGQRIMYIDVNTVFGDGNGNMRPQFSGDGTHIYAKYYSLWCDWLQKRIV